MAWFARRRAPGLSRLIAAALLLAACSQELEWRETRLAHAAVLLPGRAQTVTRAVPFEGQTLAVTMTSTGVGAAMFAIGEVQLPPQVAGDAAAQERVIAYFRDALVRNIGGTVSASVAAIAGVAARVIASLRAGAIGAGAGAHRRRASGRACGPLLHRR